MEGEAAVIKPFRDPIDLDKSPALSLIGKAAATLKGRKIGALVTDGVDGTRLKALLAAVEKEGAELALVAQRIGGVTQADGALLKVDMALSGAPSVLFDAVALLVSAEAVRPLLKDAAAIDWIRDAFGHLKVLGYEGPAEQLFEKGGIADDLDDGIIELNTAAGIKRFIGAAKLQRVWDREARLSDTPDE
jgi:catalase